jgi:histidinol-phosphate aminotransferase
MINLADNTNAWGMPPAARAAISDLSSAACYPTPQADELRAALSSYTGFPPEMITTGCGSDGVLDAAIRAFAAPGEGIAFASPTFQMIPVFAEINRLVPVVIAPGELARADAQIAYVCSPNNPTGGVAAREDIIELLRSRRRGEIVIVDEAYAEFAGTSVVDLVRDYERLLVTRTMSKAFGLPGLRVGYAIGNADLIARVQQVRGPYAVSALSEQAAVAALTDGVDWMREHAALANAARDWLISALRERGLQPLDSAANFVFLPVDGAEVIASRMFMAGVVVRYFPELSALRITAGPQPLMDAMLSALDDARRSCE